MPWDACIQRVDQPMKYQSLLHWPLLLGFLIHPIVANASTEAPSFVCPPAPATIHIVAGGSMVRCTGIGHDDYRHVPLPDDASHWQHILSLNGIIEDYLFSYIPVQEWPFRSIVISSHPAAPDVERYFVFDHHGTVVDSNDGDAIGEQLMEIRLSHVRLWPRAHVYYRMPPTPALRKGKNFNTNSRIAATSRYALVTGKDELCPVLHNRIYSVWEQPSALESASAAYIHGHCAQAFRTNPALIPDSQGTWLAYPGSSADGLNMVWSVQRHDSPVRPILDRSGNCLAQCDANESN